ncbi:MAG: bifunctional pyr operon transcriptional regulator/uracil phosphoribosyltransferase PyrR [Pseudomonadota bacterium]|nr:bifunctional pyr operon transcriptional regulator/uracil phosphoribosyltransferase PyrR [Pseudomonadota bacterium]
MTRVLDRPALLAAVDGVADRVAAAMRDVPRWALVGIRTGGVPLADRLAEAVHARTGHRPLRGDVDITLYRDDLYTGLEKPVLGDTDLPFEVSGCGIVLVDDVLFTGRTVRAAMGEVWDFGRPAFIRLAVLVDRGHRELPIAPDFVGVTIATALHDKVVVDWAVGEVVVR